MTDIKKEYKRWLESAVEDYDIKNQLLTMGEQEIADSFYRNLEFGTGGLRGIIGAGTNRMNIYVVRKATQGLANYILKQERRGDKEEPNHKLDNYPTDLSPILPYSAAIAYDSRIKSDVFAKEAARVLAANGIKVYIYDELMPTPSLSFAVRHLGCTAGICVTASHNPAKYNGYKVYGSDGCQITLEAAKAVLAEIEDIDLFNGVKLEDYDSLLDRGMIVCIGAEVTDAFLEAVYKEALTPVTAGLHVVYTPLNGSGRKCVTRILDKIGVKQITMVKEQEMPDGNFTTCPYPNPEKKEALELGLNVLEGTGADLLLATDPDCDRVGIAVKRGEQCVLLTGNETGALLLDYICKRRIETNTMPENPLAVKTIVTTELAEKIAAHYQVELINVLTGFKFIGEQIGCLEKRGEESRFIFGFEESYGYLSGSYVRDKDGVNGSMLICEMASYYKERGMTLADALKQLYETYGYYKNSLFDFTLEGASGMAKMNEIMEELRTCAPKTVGGYPVAECKDYKKGILKLPKSDVLEYGLSEGSRIIIRPSGTEPKLKVYLSVCGQSEADAVQKEELMERGIKEALHM